jgi:hypothetical protein
MTDASDMKPWRQLLYGLKHIFSWPYEPTFSNEVDAAAALFGPQTNPHDDSGSHSPSPPDE